MTPIVAVDRLFEAHLIVTDLDRSIDFYRDRLGFAPAHVMPSRQVAFFWIGSRGHSMLGLWQVTAVPQKTTTHVAFATAADEVIAAPGTLRSAGIVPLDFNAHSLPAMAATSWASGAG